MSTGGVLAGRGSGLPETQPALPALHTVPTDWMQEYHCLLTLEGLQAMVGQCLRRLQELRAGEALPCPLAEVHTLVGMRWAVLPKPYGKASSLKTRGRQAVTVPASQCTGFSSCPLGPASCPLSPCLGTNAIFVECTDLSTPGGVASM